MKHLLVLAVCSGLFAASTIALAQDTSGYPDMHGQWKGPTDALVLGRDALHHHDAKGNASEPRTSQTEFTFTIKGQDGRKFWGEVSSKETAERLSACSPVTSKPCIGLIPMAMLSASCWEGTSSSTAT
jgi:hypothetical protein